MKMVARGISVQGRLSSRRRRSPCKQRAAPWSSSWCCRLGAEALTPSRPNCQLGNVRLAYRASRCGRTRGRRHLHPAMLFFLADLFFSSMRREGGRDIVLGAQSPNFVRWSPGGDIAGSPTTGLPNSALSWLQCRRPCCWLGAARHVPPAEEWGRLSGWKPAPLLDSVGDQVGQLAGCLMFRSSTATPRPLSD